MRAYLTATQVEQLDEDGIGREVTADLGQLVIGDLDYVGSVHLCRAPGRLST